MDIKLYFLGTSAGVPTKDRNVSSILVRFGGEYIFFDFGEGTQRQLFRLGLGIGRRLKIFVTHIHGDHILGLLPTLQTLSLFKRTEELIIHGPPKLKQLIDFFLEFVESEPTFPIRFKNVYDGAVYDYGDYYVKAFRNSHTSWSFSYRFEERRRGWRFDVEKALKEDIPKEYWRVLSGGEDVTIGNKVYRWVDFVKPLNVRPRSIFISGDTMPHKRAVEAAREVDVLIHEATFLHELLERSLLTKHTTALQAAEIAKAANAKILVLTHFSARYEDASPLLNEARRIFPATFLAEELGELIIPYVKPLEE